jgi:predicted enzyme related to lactoylglutathione lyase
MKEAEMADRVIHFEVLGRDQKTLQKFYGDLFGWTFNTDNPDGYGIAPSDEAGVAVGVGNARDGSSGHVTGYSRSRTSMRPWPAPSAWAAG